MENKLTPVEWFASEAIKLHIEAANKTISIDAFVHSYNKLVEQAIEMEKEVIIKTYDVSLPFITGKEFYEHVYGK